MEQYRAAGHRRKERRRIKIDVDRIDAGKSNVNVTERAEVGRIMQRRLGSSRSIVEVGERWRRRRIGKYPESWIGVQVGRGRVVRNFERPWRVARNRRVATIRGDRPRSRQRIEIR